MFGLINAESLRNKLNKVTLVDIRSPREFDKGHIQTAILVRLFELDSLIGRVDPEKEIVIYGSCARTGAMAAQRLIKMGFKKVNILKGILKDWPYGVQR